MKASTQVLKQIYWSLGDDWWKMIIDSDCHLFGSEVFDKGLHGGAIEPGFLASLRKGMLQISSTFGQPLTLDFYLALHRTLCSHFNGMKTDTLMTGAEAGKFRRTAADALFSLKLNFGSKILHRYFYLEVHEKIKKAETMNILYPPIPLSTLCSQVIDSWANMLKNRAPRRFSRAKGFIDHIKHIADLRTHIMNESTRASDWVNRWEDGWDERVHALNAYARKIAARLECPPFVEFSMTRIPSAYDLPMKVVKVTYSSLNESDYLRILPRIFSEFNASMRRLDEIIFQAGFLSLDNRRKKLTLIGDLYQKLEWLHAFPDGQGRVDLVVLSKLLTENGFHPVILDQPYCSSTAFLDEWVDELEEGLLAWEQLQTPRVRPRIACAL